LSFSFPYYIERFFKKLFRKYLRAVVPLPLGRGRRNPPGLGRVRGIIRKNNIRGNTPLTRHFAYAHGDLSPKGRGKATALI
jgi:hypothetical protein